MAQIPAARRKKSAEPPILRELNTMVDVLIKENRNLRRQLLKLEASGVTAGPGRRANPVATGLAVMQRKLRSALEGSSAPTRRGRPAVTSTSGRQRLAPARPRKPVSPEVAAKRLEALARARAARAAKRAETDNAQAT